MAHPSQLKDVIGSRGERIVELCLTDYTGGKQPLFRPAFLGDKWPAVDFYVELNDVQGMRPYFLIQTKASTQALNAHGLRIKAEITDVERLLQFPGPTYVLGVHEPSKRVFAKSIHTGVATKTITTISLKNELTSANLKVLYDEVSAYWGKMPSKPLTSVFT